MGKHDYIIILYDYYYQLLTEKQQKYFEEYYFSNLSLSEISNNQNVSRSVISKTLNNIEEKLEKYENILKLYYKDTQLKKIVKDISDEKIKEKLEVLLR